MKRFLVILILSLIWLNPACSAYRFEDLPAGWVWDRTKIVGDMLPAVCDPNLSATDPNLWLVPLGHHVRNGTTNKWVKNLSVVSSYGSEPASLGLFLFHDPNTRESTHWTLETWSVPDPWYITIDAASYPGWFGIGKVKRYTVVGCGYLPDEFEPELR